MFEQPHCEMSEQAALGAFMYDGLKSEIVLSEFEKLSPVDFYQEINSKIFEIINHIYSNGFTPDLPAVGSKMPESKKYLTDLFKNATGAANVHYYCKTIREKAVERRMIDILSMCQNALSGKDTHQDKIDIVNRHIKNLDENRDSKEVVEIGDYLETLIEDIDHLQNADEATVNGVLTGYPDLDKYLGMLRGGELVTIGARPSVGKSALGMNIAENVATKGKSVLYITMEMTGVSLAGRVVCSQGRANNSILKTPKEADQNNWAAFSAGVQKTQGLPIFIADMPKPTANEIKTVCRKHSRKNKIDLIVVDHLHLMRHNSSMGEVQGIGDTTSELKGLAVELDAPVLLMSQLNRGNAKDGRYPTLTDLRGSGAIEQDSDIVTLIHRDDEDEELRGKALVLIAKNRAGEKGVIVPLANNLQFYRFDNYANFQEEY